MSLTFGKYAVAGIPSIVSAYKNPQRSQGFIWWMGTFAAATNIFAAGSWTVAQSFFPTVAFVCTLIVGLLHVRRKSRLAVSRAIR